MLEEMQQLREKVMQGQIAAAQLRAGAGKSGAQGSSSEEGSTGPSAAQQGEAEKIAMPGSPLAHIPVVHEQAMSGSHFVESQMSVSICTS